MSYTTTLHLGVVASLKMFENVEFIGRWDFTTKGKGERDDRSGWGRWDGDAEWQPCEDDIREMGVDGLGEGVGMGLLTTGWETRAAWGKETVPVAPRCERVPSVTAGNPTLGILEVKKAWVPHMKWDSKWKQIFTALKWHTCDSSHRGNFNNILCNHLY